MERMVDAIQRVIGAVPNMYQGLGNSPTALEGVLHTDGLLKKGQLSGAEIEAIKLAVSEAYGCDYCLAAHTLLGKKAGLTNEETISIAGPRPAQLTVQHHSSEKDARR